MYLLNITTGLLMISAGIGLLAGLDKLVITFIYLVMLTASLYFNSLCVWADSAENSLVAILTRLRKSADQTKAIKRLKLSFAVTVLAICLHFLVKIYSLSLGLNLTVFDSLNQRFFYLAVQLAMVFYSIFAVRTIQSQKQVVPDIKWYRALAYFSIYQALVFGLAIFSVYLPELDSRQVLKVVDYCFFGAFIYLALLCAETLTAIIRSIRTLVRNISEVSLPVPFFIGFFAAEDSIKSSLIRSIETISGVDVSHSEIVSFSIKILEPVIIITFIFLWLITAIVIVPPDKEAIIKRFGHVTGTVSSPPGLHFKLPWPCSTVELYDPQKIRTINIGFEPDPHQCHIIWTKPHAVKYFHLIVGDGVEIISMDCQVMFRVNNILKYVNSMQNAEEYISATAYKFLTLETVSAKFDEIISRDRKLLAEQLKNKIQASLDAEAMGVSIVEVVFLAMHPPIEVAEAYEDVISAQIDKLTYVLKANAENTHNLFMNKATAKGQELEARSYAANLVSQAMGEAASFVSRSLGYDIDPDLARFRLRLERMQQLMATKHIYIIDKTMMREKDTLFLNMQNK